MELYVGNMWWANEGQGSGRTIEKTMEEITALGINTIRLPIVPQTLDPNDPQGTGSVQSGGVMKNHESVLMDATDSYKNFITLANEHDLKVIVDIHSCSNYVGWRAGRLDAAPPWVDATRENYPYTREDKTCASGEDAYNEALWLEDLREIAQYAKDLGDDNPIMAIDIFNEPWDYTWDEWATLAERAYEAIHEVNPNLLIMVEGIGSVTSDDVEVGHGDESTNPNWAENFVGFANRPLNIPQEVLVLSPHTYGPSVFVQKQFMTGGSNCSELEDMEAADAGCIVDVEANEEKIRSGWEEHFGYLRNGSEVGLANYAIIIGEFGGDMDWPGEMTNSAVRDDWAAAVKPGTLQDKLWQEMLVKYMKEKKIEGCYWSINPESGDTGGIYTTPYRPETNEAAWGEWGEMDTRKTALLKDLWGN